MCHVLRCALPRLALPVPYSTTLMWRVPHLMLSSDTLLYSCTAQACLCVRIAHQTHAFSVLFLRLSPAVDEDVEVAEPNFIYTKATNDPGLNQLWGMLATTTGGANAVGAWSAGNTDCSDVVIGIIGEQAATAVAVAAAVAAP